MDTKLLLTKQFLNDLGIVSEDKTVKKYLHQWWKNSRLNGERSLGLTEEGYDIMSNKIGLKFYRVDLPEDVSVTNQLIIWLDKFIDCPYYLSKKSIFVSREKIAVQLILFGGNLYKFGKSKTSTQKVS